MEILELTNIIEELNRQIRQQIRHTRKEQKISVLKDWPIENIQTKSHREEKKEDEKRTHKNKFNS